VEEILAEIRTFRAPFFTFWDDQLGSYTVAEGEPTHRINPIGKMDASSIAR
jgi:hypothetical protein